MREYSIDLGAITRGKNPGAAQRGTLRRNLLVALALMLACACGASPHPAQTIAQPTTPATTAAPAASAPGVATSAEPAVPQHPPLTRLEPEPPLSGAPILSVETGMHTAPIWYAAVDAQERYLVTASVDKTIRVWSVPDGTLLRTLRVPIDGVDGGKVYAVAVSPDGRFVAAGGPHEESVYVIRVETGELVRTLRGLPSYATSLAFSHDSRYLAAGLYGVGGIQIYRTSDYQKVGEDAEYQGTVMGLDFDANGRVVSASFDARVRLYSSEFQLMQKQKLDHEAYRVAFSPDGKQIAVGFLDALGVAVLSAETLAPFFSPPVPDDDNGDLFQVAWSKDGQRLFASGRYDKAGGCPIVVWDQGGRGQPKKWRLDKNNTTSMLLPLSKGRLAVTTQDPMVGVLDSNGKTLWRQSAAIADCRAQLGALRLSADGSTVEFGLEPFGDGVHARFSLATMNIATAEDNAEALSRADSQGNANLNVTEWQGTEHPKLNGAALALDQYEMSRSLALAPDKRAFALGTEWKLRYFAKDGAKKWTVAAPGVACAVNISKDGRVVVGAFADGTIRWYRARDGQELVALFPHNDKKQWVAWTPDGFFAASPGSEGLIGYHINRGTTGTPAFVEVSQLYSAYYRPNLVYAAFTDTPKAQKQVKQALAQVGDVSKIVTSGLPPSIEITAKNQLQLNTSDYALPLSITDHGGGIGKLVVRVNGVLVDEGQTKGLPLPHAPDGKLIEARALTLNQGKNVITVTGYNSAGLVESLPQAITVHVNDPMLQPPSLYVLAVGISSYRDGDLKLKYAAKDAEDLAKLFESQGKKALYKEVYVRPLTEAQATLEGIRHAFKDLAPRVKPNDVFILYLGGHGIARDGNYSFIPQDLVIENADSLPTHALGQDEIKTLLTGIKAQKSLVLIDSCSSGTAVSAISRGGERLEDKEAMTRLMRATGRAFISASSGQQPALEGFNQHGVFTYVVLEGLKGAADSNHDGHITVDELNNYVAECVPRISNAKWHYPMRPMRDIQGQAFLVLQAAGHAGAGAIDCKLK